MRLAKIFGFFVILLSIKLITLCLAGVVPTPKDNQVAELNELEKFEVDLTKKENRKKLLLVGTVVGLTALLVGSIAGYGAYKLKEKKRKKSEGSDEKKDEEKKDA